MATIERTLTHVTKIPSWMNPSLYGIPDILIREEDAPTITDIVEQPIDFHCAETVKRDGGIIEYEKVIGTVYDDQERNGF